MATGEVDALLARFPGPVTIGIRRLKAIGFTLASLLFVALGLFLIHQPGLYPIVLGWLGIAFFGGGGFFFLAMLLPGAGRLDLTGEGFTLWSLFRKDHVRWSQLIYLGGYDQYLTYSYEIPGGVGESTSQLRGEARQQDAADDWDDDEPAEDAAPRDSASDSRHDLQPRGARLRIVDRTRRAFDNFGLPDKELVRLMRVWREYAMYAPPFAVPPPGGGGDLSAELLTERPPPPISS
jgi:hypothetical protein